jgi:hypothetical protein
MGRASSTNGEKRNAYKILLGKPEGKNHYDTNTYAVDNIKMDLRRIEWGFMECIDLTKDRDKWGTLVKTVMNLRVP